MEYKFWFFVDGEFGKINPFSLLNSDVEHYLLNLSKGKSKPKPREYEDLVLLNLVKDDKINFPLFSTEDKQVIFKYGGRIAEGIVKVTKRRLKDIRTDKQNLFAILGYYCIDIGTLDELEKRGMLIREEKRDGGKFNCWGIEDFESEEFNLGTDHFVNDVKLVCFGKTGERPSRPEFKLIKKELKPVLDKVLKEIVDEMEKINFSEYEKTQPYNNGIPLYKSIDAFYHVGIDLAIKQLIKEKIILSPEKGFVCWEEI
ncbi:hypothetical protein KO465_07355 [Candidatus Micrarchaeota archaeon]|nr:hypothetical protein [Candidatus Micrarchaeota archaeon]